MNKDIYYKIAKRQFLISFTIWFISWFFTCFTQWKLINPFQWIINLPQYHAMERFYIITMIGLYYFVSIGMLYDHFKPNNNNNGSN